MRIFSTTVGALHSRLRRATTGPSLRARISIILAGLSLIGVLAPPQLLAQPRRETPARRTAVRATTAPVATIDARILVISADGTEAGLPAIRQALDYLGIPYTVLIATAGELTPGQLAGGNHGFYQGIILATGNLADTLTPTEWETLRAYEAAFHVRQVTWYTYPTQDYGFGAPTVAVDTSVTPIAAGLTAAGQAVFQYLNAANPVTIMDAYAYLAPPADTGTVPLLTDANGSALAAVRTYADGRENLALTFDSNPFLIHTVALSYGVVNWVTKGLFLGERHIYLSAQVDDLFIENDIFGDATYRITGDDLSAVVAWQQETRREATAGQFRLDLAFNGEGTTGIFTPDTLTPAARQFRDQFKWINHTYSHANLDNVDYATARAEIQKNNQIASKLSLPGYQRLNLVTPDISGLNNPEFLRAAYALGVRYLVSDTSQPGQGNPSPNAGIYHSLKPAILMIPRRPTNLFYNVSTPDEWVAEYNEFYRYFWGFDLTYEEILDVESDLMFRYLVKGDIDPWMFHQANLRAYDAKRSLLSDLLDRTLEKYNSIFTLPLLSPTMNKLGERVAERMKYNDAGVTATIVPGQSITIRAQRATTVPVTGVRAGAYEIYGGQNISFIKLTAGQSVTLSLR